MTFRKILSHLRNWRSRRLLQVDQLQRQLSPVFIIGCNRSGTSVVSSILNQHPELEGIFSGETESTYNETGHSKGFCESYHLWNFLINLNYDNRGQERQLPFWSLPQYLAAFYRNHPKNRNEIFDIIWDLQQHRATEKQPLIKNQYNMLRIGLMSKVFPRARYVLVSRPWDSFIKRGIHKWTHDGNNTLLSTDCPRVGFHWHLANLIARYDLETYAPGRYAEVWLDVLHQGHEAAQEAFQKVLSTLSITQFKFNLKVLEPQWLKYKHGVPVRDKSDFDLIKHIVEFERQVHTDMGSRPQA